MEATAVKPRLPVEGTAGYFETLSIDTLRELAKEYGLTAGRSTAVKYASKPALCSLLRTGELENVEIPETNPPTPQGTPSATPKPNGNGHGQPNASDAQAALDALKTLLGAKSDPVDYDRISDWINARVQEHVKRPVEIHVPERQTVTLKKRTHAQFERALKKASLERQILLIGPAGTGKTTLAEHIAEALSLPFGVLSCSAGMSESALLGRMNAHGEYVISSFVKIYTEGGLFCLDEMDAADANVMLVINSALANGHLATPADVKAPLKARHKDFVFVGCANTFGTGPNSQYVGRNQLDAATLDRFVIGRIYVDYDPELEKEISAKYPEFLKAVNQMRSNVTKHNLRLIVSTRLVISGVRAMDAGDTLQQVLSDFQVGMNQQTLAKLMEGSN